MAPRSQEPQEKLYLVTILLLYLEKNFSIEYVTKSISQFNAKEEVKKRFFKDFGKDICEQPYCKKMSVEVEEILLTDSYKEISDEEKKSIKIEIQKLKKAEIEKQSIAKKKKELPKWFCEYNVKLGDVKYRKGTIIENVDNEIDARKQLDIYIKRNFSKVRSVTKVDIKQWNGEEEFSNEIIEKTLKTEPIANIEPMKKTLEDMINENFSEEDLNQKCLQIVIKTSKIRPKDFDDGFILREDEDQTDEELFNEFKKDIPHLKKKYFSVKRTNFKNILTTTQYKRMINSDLFKKAVEKDHDGFAGLEAANEIIKERLEKELNKVKASFYDLQKDMEKRKFTLFG